MKSAFFIALLAILVSCGKDTKTKIKYVEAKQKDTRMNCEVYDVIGQNSLPDFSSLTSLGSLKVDRLNSPSTGAADVMPTLSGSAFESHVEQFGLVCEGEIELALNGTHTFYLNSDDGSKLFINDVQIIANDGLHGMVKKSAAVGLNKGKIKVRIEYFNGFGQKGLVLSLKEPNGLEEIVKF